MLNQRELAGVLSTLQEDDLFEEHKKKTVKELIVSIDHVLKEKNRKQMFHAGGQQKNMISHRTAEDVEEALLLLDPAAHHRALAFFEANGFTSERQEEEERWSNVGKAFISGFGLSMACSAEVGKNANIKGDDDSDDQDDEEKGKESDDDGHLVEQSMVIYIQLPSGDVNRLTVEASYTIDNIKMVIKGITGIPRTEQHFMFGGVELKTASSMLSDYDVEEFSVLILLPRVTRVARDFTVVR
jgi:hypothetical protein